jgi:hypothetical protein
LRYSGSKTILALSPLTSPLCRGMPNFVGKSVLMVAIGFNSYFIGVFEVFRIIRILRIIRGLRAVGII